MDIISSKWTWAVNNSHHIFINTTVLVVQDESKVLEPFFNLPDPSFTFKSSSQKSLGQIKPSLEGMFNGLFSKNLLFFFCSEIRHRIKEFQRCFKGCFVFSCGSFIFQPFLNIFFSMLLYNSIYKCIMPAYFVWLFLFPRYYKGAHSLHA